MSSATSTIHPSGPEVAVPRGSRILVGGGAAVLARPLVRLTFRPTVIGREHLPAGGCVVSANHLSGFDAWALTYTLRPRRVRFMGKNELFRRPLARLVVRSLGVFPARSEGAQRGGVELATESRGRARRLRSSPRARAVGASSGGPATAQRGSRSRAAFRWFRWRWQGWTDGATAGACTWSWARPSTSTTFAVSPVRRSCASRRRVCGRRSSSSRRRSRRAGRRREASARTAAPLCVEQHREARRSGAKPKPLARQPPRTARRCRPPSDTPEPARRRAPRAHERSRPL